MPVVLRPQTFAGKIPTCELTTHGLTWHAEEPCANSYKACMSLTVRSTAGYRGGGGKQVGIITRPIFG